MSTRISSAPRSVGVPEAQQHVLTRDQAAHLAGRIMESQDPKAELQRQATTAGGAWPHLFKDAIALGKLPAGYQAVQVLDDPVSPAVLPAGHHRFEVLRLGRRVAAQLAVDAVDPAFALAMAERYALATLAVAVEAETARRADVEPRTVELLPLLAADLARIECAALPNDPAPPPAAG